jgi:tetratricopeptide (TPR) repeat protein
VFKNALILIVCLLFSHAYSFAANPIRILIFPLVGSTRNSSTSWIGEGVALALSEQLSGPSIQVISRPERIELLERNDLPPIAELSRGSMIFIAQQASADLVVMGNYQGTEQNLRLSVWVLNLKTLKLSSEIISSGPLAAAPQMENELAWMILSNAGFDGGISREKFRNKTRKVLNLAYAHYIQSLNASSENDQIRLLEKALQVYPEFPDAHFQLGRLYYQKRDYSNAIPHLSQSSTIIDILPQSLFFIGNCYLQENKNVQAIQSFSRALSISQRSDILNNLAVAHFRIGDLASSLQDLMDAKNLAHSDSTIAMNLAILRHLTGNNSEALNVLEDSLKSHPENGMLHFLMGFLLKAKGEKDKALQAMTKASNLGIQVDTLQGENPQMWIRIILGWSNSGLNISTTSRQ